MRVASKIAVGSGLMIALLVGVLFYGMTLVQRLSEVNTSLSEITFRDTRLVLEQSRLIDRLEFLTRKLQASGDPLYAAALGEIRQQLDTRFEELAGLHPDTDERQPASRFLETWRESREQIVSLEASAVDLASEPTTELITQVLESTQVLAEQADSLLDATQREIGLQVVAFEAAAEEARRTAWWTAGAALFLGLTVLWLTVRSINEPLRRLTEGTRAVADGEFLYRLDASRNDEFSHLARSFNEMVLRLRELDEMKRGFISHVSHELRTPLVAMHETNELLLDEIPGPLTSKQRRLLQINRQSGRRLAAMISKLLDISRMEATTVSYELEAQDLASIVEQTAAELDAAAAERNVRVEVHADDARPWISCDRDRMAQVVHNLVENAVKFSPAGETVRVDVGPAEVDALEISDPWARHVADTAEAGALALIQVADRGSGVPVEHKRRIFEKFHQVDARGASGGVGLGLAICREIAQAHRGAVWVVDRPGGGSIFSVLMPAVASAPAARPATAGTG